MDARAFHGRLGFDQALDWSNGHACLRFSSLDDDVEQTPAAKAAFILRVYGTPEGVPFPLLQRSRIFLEYDGGCCDCRVLF
jgi:hypothetical protein